jgi:hypothetical protein
MENDQTMDSNVNNSENVENSLKDAKINDIISNIELLIDTYLKDHDINSIKDLTQQEYNGLLMYIQLQYIRPTKCLFLHSQGLSHDHNITLMYDDDIVYSVAMYYIYMSYNNNKVVQPFGFSLMTGIETDTIRNWKTLESQRPKAFGLSKTLYEVYENSLENGAQSGKNPVGFIATLNHRFGWSSEGKATLTVNITRNKDEIMSSVNPELITDKS